MYQTSTESLSSRQSGLIEKWRKLQARLQRKLKDGTFYQLSHRKRHQLLQRLQRYARQLQRLGFSMKRLAIGSTLALSLVLTAPTQAQTFVEQTGMDNPFNGVNVGIQSTPALVDIDNDGDLDAFIGEFDGTIKSFENTGTNTDPTFVEQTGTDNPFNGVDVGLQSAPTLVDIDNDGDLDACIGERYGTIIFFENTGSSTSPTFVEQTDMDNPFNNVDVGNFSKPALVDIDNDGDLDACIGNFDGTIIFFENTGSNSDPAFIEQTGMENPFNGVDVGFISAPALVDIDNDGDLDAFIGENDGTIKFFENTGSNNAPAFVEQTGIDNPLDGGNQVGYSSPTLVDIDNDGDLDACIGETEGNINFFENTQLSFTASLTAQGQLGDLYPNPTKADMVHIDYTSVKAEELPLQVVDISGRVVMSQVLPVFEGDNTLTLDASTLNKGLYFVQIGAAGEQGQRKLVIE
jgi:hypothetical protein